MSSTDQGWDDVLAEIGRDGKLAAVKGGVADAVDALVRFDFQRDKIAAGAAHDDPAIYYFHALTVDNGKVVATRSMPT
jgi:hypothetical protein